MTSNLPNEQKTNWVSNEFVMPVDTNAWGTAINLLKKCIPIYASNGNFYSIKSRNGNALSLQTISFNDGTENETVDSYINGMNIWFLSNFNNTGSVTVNVNNLGTKTVYQTNNTTLKANQIKSGYYIHLIYNNTQDRFYLVSADILPEISGQSGKFLTNNGTDLFWSNVPSPITLSYEE